MYGGSAQAASKRGKRRIGNQRFVIVITPGNCTDTAQQDAAMPPVAKHAKNGVIGATSSHRGSGKNQP
jgi:hypothetical protein